MDQLTHGNKASPANISDLSAGKLMNDYLVRNVGQRIPLENIPDVAPPSIKLGRKSPLPLRPGVSIQRAFDMDKMVEGKVDPHDVQLAFEELFTAEERDRYLAMSDPGLSFARAFCCKEACSKALGTGFANNVDPRDIELSSACLAITVLLHGKARTQAGRMTPSGYNFEFIVSIGRSDLIASSFVILEAVSR